MGRWFIKKFLKQVRNNILTGIFLIIPLIGSVWIIVKLFVWADSALPGIFGQDWIVGTGLLVTLLLAYITGLATKYWLGRKIIASGNSVIARVPILNKIYLVLKQIIETVTGDKKKLFERAVLIEFPQKGSYGLGFVTSQKNEMFSTLTTRNLVAVFLPTAPNPTTGFLLYIPEEDIITLDMPVETAIKLIVSAGLLSKDRLAETQTLPDSPNHWNWLDIFKKKHKGEARHLHDPRD
jgi:uncharacterized membrane protein